MSREDLIDKLLTPVSEELTELSNPPPELRKQKQRGLHLALKKEVLEIGSHLEKAILLLQETYSKLTPPDQEKVKNDLKPLVGLIQNLSQNPSLDYLLHMQTGTSMQQFLKLSDDLCLWIYETGYTLAQTQESEKALCLFQLLVFLNGEVPSYWVALGLMQRALHLEEKALFSFAAASICDPLNPLARYHSADIYLSQHQFEDAKAELGVLAGIAQHTPDWLPPLNLLTQKLQLANNGRVS